MVLKLFVFVKQIKLFWNFLHKFMIVIDIYTQKVNWIVFEEKKTISKFSKLTSLNREHSNHINEMVVVNLWVYEITYFNIWKWHPKKITIFLTKYLEKYFPNMVWANKKLWISIQSWPPLGSIFGVSHS